MYNSLMVPFLRLSTRRTRAALLSLLAMGLLRAPVHAQGQRPAFDTPYVTRAEAVMLLLQTRIPQVPQRSANGEFADVLAGEWYERYLVVGERLGIVRADQARKLRPNDPVTRAEFLSMAAKTFGINGFLFPSHYRDISIDMWEAEFAGIAETFRLFPQDVETQLLRPGAPMIHGEVAKAVRILNDVAARKAVSDRETAQEQSTWQLQLYERLSSRKESVTLVGGDTPVRAGPSIAQPQTTFSWTMLTQLPGSNPEAQPILRAAVIALVNQARRSAGIAPLTENPSLTQSAQGYAQQMATGGFFGHTDPAGRTLKERMEASGYYAPFFNVACLCTERYLLGENLASGQRTPQQVMQDWLRSKTHREAIFNPVFTDIGIGISAGIWVQHFGGKQR